MPGKYDGYVTPVAGGYEAAAEGTTIGVYDTQEEAVKRARACGRLDAPVWLVGLDGEATEAL